MILAGKVMFLLILFMCAPNLIVSGFRGHSIAAGNVFFSAIGAVGFITLQWLI